MFGLDTAHTINALVDDILRTLQIEDGDNKVMFVNLRLEVAASKRDDEPKVRRFLHFMYYAPSNYVLVGTQETDSRLFDHLRWERKSYHDSCWRSDGTNSVLQQVYFKMCKEAFPDRAPIDCHATAVIENIRFREVKSVNHSPDNREIKIEFPSIK